MRSQKKGHKREALSQFLLSMRRDLESRSMGDLSFGKRMATGYVKTTLTGEKISNEVWTLNFWGDVRSELASKSGLHELFWLYNNHSEGAVIMLSRAGRSELYANAALMSDLAKARGEMKQHES